MNLTAIGIKGVHELSSRLFNNGGLKYEFAPTTEAPTPDMNPAGVSADVGILVAVILSVISFLALIQNGMFLTTFFVCRELVTPTNMFILALSVCDLLVAGLGNPFVVAASVNRHWYLGHTMCVFYGFIMTFLGLTSITLLTAISLDRYVLIVRTMRSMTIDCRVALRAIGGCVLYALVWSGMPLLGWNGYVLEASGLACSVDWQSKSPASTSYIILLLIGCLFLPLILIGFSYSKIFIRVYKKSHSSQMTQINSRIETKVAKTIFFVTLAFLTSWLPYAIVSLLFVLGDPGHIITPAAEISCAILAKCSVIWNPLIYVMTNAQLRNSMLDVFRAICIYLGCNRKEYTVNGRVEHFEMRKSSRRHRSFRREDASLNTEVSMADHTKIVQQDTVNVSLIHKNTRLLQREQNLTEMSIDADSSEAEKGVLDDPTGV